MKVEKISIEFDSYSSLKKFIREESGIDNIQSMLFRAEKELLDIRNEKTKSLITSDVVSDTYSIDNIKNVVSFIEEKCLTFESKHEESISLSNLYSNVVRRIIREYPTLNKEVCVALWKSAWKYGIELDAFYKDPKTQKVILKRRMIGNSTD